jgi:hypothetical protein
MNRRYYLGAMVSFLVAGCATVPYVEHQGCDVVDVDIRGRYQGECNSKQQAHGYGKSVGADTYQGNFYYGMKHGSGVYIWSNGDRFTGSFREDKPHGRGVMMYIDGVREEGIWQDGIPTQTTIIQG